MASSSQRIAARPAPAFWTFQQSDGHENVFFPGHVLPNSGTCTAFRPTPGVHGVLVDAGASASGNPYVASFASFLPKETVLSAAARQTKDCSPDMPFSSAGGGGVVVGKQLAASSPHAPIVNKSFASVSQQPFYPPPVSSPGAQLNCTDSLQTGCCLLRPLPATSQSSVSSFRQPFSPAQPHVSSPSFPRGSLVQDSQVPTICDLRPCTDTPKFPRSSHPPAPTQARLSAPETLSVSDPRHGVEGGPRASWEASFLSSEGGFAFSTPFRTPQSLGGDEHRHSSSSVQGIPNAPLATEGPVGSERLSETGNQAADTLFFVSPTLTTPSLTAVVAGPSAVASPGAPRRLGQFPSPSPPVSQETFSVPRIAAVSPQRPQSLGTFESTQLWGPQFLREAAPLVSRAPNAGDPAPGVGTPRVALGQGLAPGSAWPARDGQKAQGRESPKNAFHSKAGNELRPETLSAQSLNPPNLLWQPASGSPEPRILWPQASVQNFGVADSPGSQLEPEERHRLHAVQHLVRQTQELIADTERRLSSGWRTLEGAGVGQTSAQIDPQSVGGDNSHEEERSGKSAASGSGRVQPQCLPTAPDSQTGAWTSLNGLHVLEPNFSQSSRQTFAEQARVSQGTELRPGWTDSRKGGEPAAQSLEEPHTHRYEDRFEDNSCRAFAVDGVEGEKTQRQTWGQESLAAVEPTGDRLQSRSYRGREEGATATAETTRSASVASSVASEEEESDGDRNRLRLLRARRLVGDCRRFGSSESHLGFFNSSSSLHSGGSHFSDIRQQSAALLSPVALASPSSKISPSLSRAPASRKGSDSFEGVGRGVHAQSAPHAPASCTYTRSAGSGSGVGGSQSSHSSSRVCGREAQQCSGFRPGEKPGSRRAVCRGLQTHAPEPLRRAGAPVENMGVSIAGRRTPSENADLFRDREAGNRRLAARSEKLAGVQRDGTVSGESNQRGETKRAGLPNPERRGSPRGRLHATLWKRESSDSSRDESWTASVSATRGEVPDRGRDASTSQNLSTSQSLSVSRGLSQRSVSPESRLGSSGGRSRRFLAQERRPQMQRSASRSLSRACLSEDGGVDATMQDGSSQSFAASGVTREPRKLNKPLAGFARRGLASRTAAGHSPSAVSSRSSNGSRKGDSEERGGFEAATGRARRPLGAVHSSLGGAGAVRYLTHEELQPFDEPPCMKAIEETVLPRLGVEVTKGDWTEQIETLDTIRRLAKFHFAVFTQDVLRQVVGGILAWLASPRSTVAKNACLALSDLFLFGRKKMDPCVLEVVELCMKKCCQSNEFLNEAVRSVLFTVCQFASESRVLHAFLHCIPPCKQPGAKSTAASCLALLFQRTSEQAARGSELSQSVKLLLNMATEASPDVRVAARVALTMLHRTVDAATLRRVCGSLEARNKMDGFVSRTTNREVEDVMKNVEASVPAAGGCASLASSLSSVPDDSRSRGRGHSGGSGGYRPLLLGHMKP
ncbi:CLASP amine-terminal protein [Toxoplasma gondii RUB]|uniref:CLASP amine-terminal protein n=1 Tax=Toxoplasma gondii RUB TaxID=935652 RepID=A0A086MAV9_TOXGO|nr:CLASP amine-terminal protein [Toxoplasma gondii RUB]